jgi:hypothetical protein
MANLLHDDDDEDLMQPGDWLDTVPEIGDD